MKSTSYCMLISHLLWWLLYTILTRAFFAVAIVFVGAFFAIPLGLDTKLHMSFQNILLVTIVSFLIYLVVVVSKEIIFISIKDSKLVLWSLVRRYVVKRDEIESVEEIVIKPKLVGFSQWPGVGFPFKSDQRILMQIQTKKYKLRANLSLNTFVGQWAQSFGPETAQIVPQLRRWANSTTSI